MESHLICSPTRIDSFILPSSSKVFWGSALLLFFDYWRVLRSRLDWDRSQLSTIGIANQLRLPPNAIAWIERCFLWLSQSLQVSFLCQLRLEQSTARSVACPSLSPARPISIFVHGTAVLLPSGRDGTEWKNVTVFFGCYCKSSLGHTNLYTSQQMYKSSLGQAERLQMQIESYLSVTHNAAVVMISGQGLPC